MENKWNLSRINRKTFTTLAQLNSYIRIGLFLKKDASQKYQFEDLQMKKLFYIKALSKINFSLRDIKYILSELNENKLKSALLYYFRLEEKEAPKFYSNVEKFLTSGDNIELYTSSTFKFLTHSFKAPSIITKLFISRKKWYVDEDKKLLLRKNRKLIFSEFTNFNVTKRDEVFLKVSEHFQILLDFLIQNGHSEWLDFLCFIGWITTEPRYIRQMKRITRTNESREIFDSALKFIIQKENEKY